MKIWRTAAKIFRLKFNENENMAEGCQNFPFYVMSSSRKKILKMNPAPPGERFLSRKKKLVFKPHPPQARFFFSFFSFCFFFYATFYTLKILIFLFLFFIFFQIYLKNNNKSKIIYKNS